MTVTTEVNPVKKVYDALWQMLHDHEGFKGLVKVGNEVSFMGKHAWKDQVQVADMPEVQIVPTVTTPHLQRTSNGSSMLERFEVRVATGSQRLDEVLFVIRWEVYRALSDWATRLQALTWKGNKYVKLVRPVQITEGMIDKSVERGVTGWFAVWAGEIEMWFRTIDLQGG